MVTAMRTLGLTCLLVAAQAAPLRGEATDPAMSMAPAKLDKQTCTLSAQLASLRQALLRGSPALKRFLRKQLRELAPAIPESELRTALSREHDPAMIEELTGALAARMARLNEPSALRAPLERATSDANPAARAAAIRGLRGTASVEAMTKLGGVDYQRLMRDPAPAVREAVVSNLLAESSQVYFGHDRAVSETAIAVALAARSGPAADPAQAARLLSEVSTESVGHQAVEELLSLLDGPIDASPPVLRAAVVTALGGVPSTESALVQKRLLEHYRRDSAKEVRRAILESLVRLAMTGAPPILESLRSVDSGLHAEIDVWQEALRSGLQEWSLLQREKQRLQSAAGDGSRSPGSTSP
jgi:hypothetical protein